MEIVVFGAGSLGSLIGGLLARAHEVTLVGRNPHMRRVNEYGLRISGHIETTVQPHGYVTPPDSADLAVVCVKGFDTEHAAETLSACSLDCVLSLQNGMGNEAILADHLSASVLAGTCTYGAITPTAGEVRCTGIGTVILGPTEGGKSTTVDRVGAAFEEANIATVIATDMQRQLWKKLSVNAGINPITALSGIDNGAVLEGETRGVAMAAARETAQVARNTGIDLRDETVERSLERVVTDTAQNVSSMRQDMEAGRRTEINNINGYVVDRADQYGVSVPVNRTLSALVHAWEAERAL